MVDEALVVEEASGVDAVPEERLEGCRDYPLHDGAGIGMEQEAWIEEMFRRSTGNERISR